jgi:hypothetical protein
MGFLDVLSKIVNPIGGPASALGTGLAENRAGQNQFADSRGRTLANIYGSQLGAQTGIYGSQANQQTSQYNTQQQAMLQALLGASNEGQQNALIDLNRRKFALDAPGTRARQATQGSILQSLQPYSTSGGSSRLQAHTPTVSGGPLSALGPGAREAGRLLEQGALAGLKSGDTFDPLPKTDFQGGVMKPPGILAAPSPIAAPTLPGYQGPGGLESLLGALGLAPGIVNAIKNALKGGGAGVPGSGVPGDQGPPSPYDPNIDWQGPIDTGPVGDTSGRFYGGNVGDPSNPDWQGPPDANWWETPNPYSFGGGVDTTPPDINWEW